MQPGHNIDFTGGENKKEPMQGRQKRASETIGRAGLPLLYDDAAVIAQTILFLPVVQMALRFAGLQWTTGLVRRVVRARRNPARPVLPLDVERMAQIVRACCVHWPFHATCLDRSLITALLLGLHRVPVSICFGFRKRDLQLEGHAWVEYNDVPVAELSDVTELSRLCIYNTVRQ
jgi:Transglutaminase-like superfamily